jgi:hypothetical protein
MAVSSGFGHQQNISNAILKRINKVVERGAKTEGWRDGERERDA